MLEARWWFRWSCLSCLALALSGCVVLPGKGRTWFLGIDTYAQAAQPLTSYHVTYETALAVGTEAELEVAFHPDGCKVEMGYIGSGPGRTCLDGLAGHNADRKVSVTASTTAPVFSATPSGNKVRLRALADGEAQVKITAKNREGKTLSADLQLRAATPGRLVAEARSDEGRNKPGGCLDGRKPSRLWFEAGRPFTLAYAVLSREVPKQYVILGVPAKVTAKGSAGFSQTSYREINSSRNVPIAAEGTYVMTEPGTFDLTSATMPAFKVTGGAYRCQELTGIAFRDVVRTPREAAFDLAPMMGDDPVCTTVRGCTLEARVETPEVCAPARMNGEGIDGDRVYQGKYKVVRRTAGTCRVTAKIAGTSLQTRLEIEFPELPPASKSGG